MARRIIRTTEQTAEIDRGPVFEGESPVQPMQGRVALRTHRETLGETMYDPGTTAPKVYTGPAPLVTNSHGLAGLSSRMQAQEDWSRQQTLLLQDIGDRLTNLEEGTHIWTSAMSLEQSTWWALWGVLMLVLGSALAVLVILVFSILVR